uniref:Ubiquitin-like-conjugating enzyme ATG10 n=1 Tax=Bionectria ochroleuca TaxID=29856 RepID=A0A8H7TNX0_BIOOC
MEIANFPSLTGEEFLEACHHLDGAYCKAQLGSLRKRWKLRLRMAVQADFLFQDVPNSYIEITRPLDPEDLDIDLESLTISSGTEERGENMSGMDQEMMEIEESDQAVLRKPVTQRDGAIVCYEIHLHPTYRMPCLWFQIQGLDTGESQYDLDTVFRYLVPEQYKEGLRRYGGIGGISLDNHPVKGDPWFFVHPCLTGDNMSAFKCQISEYLTIWLGLVGGCVGLWVPRQMATIK